MSGKKGGAGQGAAAGGRRCGAPFGFRHLDETTKNCFVSLAFSSSKDAASLVRPSAHESYFPREPTARAIACPACWFEGETCERKKRTTQEKQGGEKEVNVFFAFLFFVTLFHLVADEGEKKKKQRGRQTRFFLAREQRILALLRSFESSVLSLTEQGLSALLPPTPTGAGSRKKMQPEPGRTEASASLPSRDDPDQRPCSPLPTSSRPIAVSSSSRPHHGGGGPSCAGLSADAAAAAASSSSGFGETATRRASSSSTPPRSRPPPLSPSAPLSSSLGGHSPESRFLQAYSVSELHNSPITFGLAAPKELRKQAAADFAARHSDGSNGGGGGGAGGGAAVAGSPPPSPPLSSSSPPSSGHPAAIASTLFPSVPNGDESAKNDSKSENSGRRRNSSGRRNGSGASQLVAAAMGAPLEPAGLFGDRPVDTSAAAPAARADVSAAAAHVAPRQQEEEEQEHGGATLAAAAPTSTSPPPRTAAAALRPSQPSPSSSPERRRREEKQQQQQQPLAATAAATPAPVVPVAAVAAGSEQHAAAAAAAAASDNNGAPPPPRSSKPWPLAAPAGVWLYDFTLQGVPPLRAAAAAADAALAAAVLRSRRCSKESIGPWSPSLEATLELDGSPSPSAAPSSSASPTPPPSPCPPPQAARRRISYCAPVPGAGLMGSREVTCEEEQTLKVSFSLKERSGRQQQQQQKERGSADAAAAENVREEDEEEEEEAADAARETPAAAAENGGVGGVGTSAAAAASLPAATTSSRPPSKKPRPPHHHHASWTLKTIAHTRDGIPSVALGAFHCEVTLHGSAVVAAAPPSAGGEELGVSTRVTAFARVVFHRKIPVLSRAIEAQALSGLKEAYRVHGEELRASFGEHGRAAAEAAAEKKALERAAAAALRAPRSPSPLLDDETVKLVLAALFLLLAATAAAAAALAIQLSGLRAALKVLGAAALEAAEAARRAAEEARKRG